MTHDVFICHSSKDRTIANAICSKLEQNHIRCWIAPRDVIPGSEFAQSIVEAIGAAKLTVLVFSDNSNRSPHIHREIERSVSHGIPILPFRLEEVVPSPALEYFISDAHWLDAMTPPLEHHLDQLVGTVKVLLEREAVRAGTGPVSSPAPIPAAPPPPPSGTVLPAPIDPGGDGRRRPRTIVIAAIVAAVVIIAGIAAFALTRGSSEPSPSATTSPSAATSPSATSTIKTDSHTVTYKATTTGESVVSFTNLSDKEDTKTIIKDWSMKLVVPSGKLEAVGLALAAIDESSKGSCEILIDGVSVSKKSGSISRDDVTCSAALP